MDTPRQPGEPEQIPLDEDPNGENLDGLINAVWNIEDTETGSPTSIIPREGPRDLGHALEVIPFLLGDRANIAAPHQPPSGAPSTSNGVEANNRHEAGNFLADRPDALGDASAPLNYNGGADDSPLRDCGDEAMGESLTDHQAAGRSSLSEAKVEHNLHGTDHYEQDNIDTGPLNNSARAYDSPQFVSREEATARHAISRRSTLTQARNVIGMYWIDHYERGNFGMARPTCNRRNYVMDFVQHSSIDEAISQFLAEHEAEAADRSTLSLAHNENRLHGMDYFEQANTENMPLTEMGPLNHNGDADDSSQQVSCDEAMGESLTDHRAADSIPHSQAQDENDLHGMDSNEQCNTDMVLRNNSADADDSPLQVSRDEAMGEPLTGHEAAGQGRSALSHAQNENELRGMDYFVQDNIGLALRNNSVDVDDSPYHVSCDEAMDEPLTGHEAAGRSTLSQGQDENSFYGTDHYEQDNIYTAPLENRGDAGDSPQHVSRDEAMGNIF